jgi:hypothetical protein
MRDGLHQTEPTRGRLWLACAALALAAALAPADAHAQGLGLFDFLFGRPPPQAQPPARQLPPAAPGTQIRPGTGSQFGPPGSESRSVGVGTGRSQTYCVRMCDGRYFPMERFGNVQPARLCAAFCPASPTKVFTGSVIDHSVAADGERYAGTKNAFVYRKRIVSDCTCNGRDQFGLATLDPTSDPTLRPGDSIDGGATTLRAAPAGTRNPGATLSNPTGPGPRPPQ